MNEIEIKTKRTDLIMLYRVLDTAFAELEAAVADGLIKEDVLIELEDALKIVKDYLKQ